MAKEKRSKMIANVRAKSHRGVDTVMDKAESVRTSTNDGVARLKEKGVEYRENVDSYISEHPEKSVLIAAGVGVVAGAVAASALMRKKQE